MNQSLSLAEILAALRPVYDEASETDDEGTYLHPERRRALDVAWLMIVEASANKQARAIHPMGCLNADLAHNRDMA